MAIAIDSRIKYDLNLFLKQILHFKTIWDKFGQKSRNLGVKMKIWYF